MISDSTLKILFEQSQCIQKEHLVKFKVDDENEMKSRIDFRSEIKRLN